MPLTTLFAVFGDRYRGIPAHKPHGNEKLEKQNNAIAWIRGVAMSVSQCTNTDDTAIKAYIAHSHDMAEFENLYGFPMGGSYQTINICNVQVRKQPCYYFCRDSEDQPFYFSTPSYYFMVPYFELNFLAPIDSKTWDHYQFNKKNILPQEGLAYFSVEAYSNQQDHRNIPRLRYARNENVDIYVDVPFFNQYEAQERLDFAKITALQVRNGELQLQNI